MEERGKSIPLTHKYMTAHFPRLVQVMAESTLTQTYEIMQATTCP